MLPKPRQRRSQATARWRPKAGGLGQDFLASGTLLAVAVPEQIATAGLAGAPPSFGLIAFITASLGFFLVGANRYLSVGADSTISPIFAAALALLAVNGNRNYPALTAELALMVGAIVVLTGLLRLGRIAQLLSIPVITGFLTGIAIHIAISQLPAILGLPSDHHVLLKELTTIVEGLGNTNLFALAIAIGVLGSVLTSEKLFPRLPAALIAIVVASVLVEGFGLEQRGIQTIGTLSMPTLWPPNLAYSIADVLAIIPVAFLIALIVVIQTVTVSRSFPDPRVTDVNRDLAGVGVANLLTGLCGGFPVNSSPPRTAIAAENSASSRKTGLFAALGTVAILLLGRPYLATIPKPALSGLLLFVAWRIFRIDIIRQIWSQSRAEFFLLFATAVVIVVLPIQTGVTIGIGLSLLHGVWTITQTQAVLFEQVPGSTVWWPKALKANGITRPGIVVVGFQAPLFFMNAETFRRSVTDTVTLAQKPVRVVILEASTIADVDYSAAQTLIEMIESWKAQGILFCIARLESTRAQESLKKFGVLQRMDEQAIFQSVDAAVRHIPV